MTSSETAAVSETHQLVMKMFWSGLIIICERAATNKVAVMASLRPKSVLC